MGNMNERNLVAISIKHTEYKWRFGKPCVLWGDHRTKDDEERCYAGYTIFLNNAELYSLEDWANSGYMCDWMKLDAPVKLCVDFCKKYKKFDTVLVMLEDYIKYCAFAELPLDRQKEVFE